jgi:hypothetical protein
MAHRNANIPANGAWDREYPKYCLVSVEKRNPPKIHIRPRRTPPPDIGRLTLAAVLALTALPAATNGVRLILDVTADHSATRDRSTKLQIDLVWVVTHHKWLVSMCSKLLERDKYGILFGAQKR